MNIPILGGLSGVAGDYDLFIVDLWGVVVLRGMGAHRQCRPPRREVGNILHSKRWIRAKLDPSKQQSSAGTQDGAAGLLWILTLFFETGTIIWSAPFIASLVWLILANSMGAFTLFYILIRRGAAAKVASLFYLVPPLVAIEAWLLFGESLAPIAIFGMAVTASGVALVTKSTS